MRAQALRRAGETRGNYGRRQEGERLYRIDEALRRLYADPEAFGVCARCGKPIGMARLDVVPETTLCADCQRAVEA